jgi:two-component sensor histidine kinase/CheY-like chemotaxis protein
MARRESELVEQTEITGGSIQVLLVEDNPGDARLFQWMLAGVTSPQFELTQVERLSQALEHLDNTHCDAVLLDLQLPDAQGLNTFRQVHQHAPQLPVIVLTALDDESLALTAVRESAQDYLTKGQIDTNLLVRAIRYAIERKRASEELRRYREHLEELVRERTAELSEANERLRQEIAERLQAEEQIRASLQEKELLLMEIHDRVKNNLQVITSMLDLQSMHIDEPQALQVIRESQNRIRTMALIHEGLYRSDDFARIDVRAYVQGIVRYLQEAYSRRAAHINLAVRVDDIHLNPDEAITCGLVINELTTNALKHAFRFEEDGSLPLDREPTIQVALSATDGDRLCLEVRDNGVGLAPHFDVQTPKSFGLRLVHMLTQQLKGELELDRCVGTTFRITFTNTVPATPEEAT